MASVLPRGRRRDEKAEKLLLSGIFLARCKKDLGKIIESKVLAFPTDAETVFGRLKVDLA